MRCKVERMGGHEERGLGELWEVFSTGFSFVSLTAVSSSLDRLRFASSVAELLLLGWNSLSLLGRRALPSLSSPSSGFPPSGKSFFAQLPLPPPEAPDFEGDAESRPPPGLCDPPRRRMADAGAAVSEDPRGARILEAARLVAKVCSEVATRGPRTRTARASSIRCPKILPGVRL